jgi:diphthine methyl ester synthase
MLYLVGLGLADETDITVKGLEVVKRSERVYLEAYTSILHVGKEKLVGSPHATASQAYLADMILF